MQRRRHSEDTPETEQSSSARGILAGGEGIMAGWKLSPESIGLLAPPSPPTALRREALQAAELRQRLVPHQPGHLDPGCRAQAGPHGLNGLNCTTDVRGEGWGWGLGGARAALSASEGGAQRFCAASSAAVRESATQASMYAALSTLDWRALDWGGRRSALARAAPGPTLGHQLTPCFAPPPPDSPLV